MFRAGIQTVAIVLLLAASVTADETSDAGLVRGIKVLPDKAPDCSSLKSIKPRFLLLDLS